MRATGHDPYEQSQPRSPACCEREIAEQRATISRLTADLEAAKRDVDVWNTSGLCLRCGALVEKREIERGTHGQEACPGPMRRFSQVMDAVKMHATARLMEADCKTLDAQEQAAAAARTVREVARAGYDAAKEVEALRARIEAGIAERDRLRATLNEWAQIAAQACEDDEGGFTVVSVRCSAYARLVEQTATALRGEEVRRG